MPWLCPVCMSSSLTSACSSSGLGRAGSATRAIRGAAAQHADPPLRRGRTRCDLLKRSGRASMSACMHACVFVPAVSRLLFALLRSHPKRMCFHTTNTHRHGTPIARSLLLIVYGLPFRVVSRSARRSAACGISQARRAPITLAGRVGIACCSPTSGSTTEAGSRPSCHRLLSLQGVV